MTGWDNQNQIFLKNVHVSLIDAMLTVVRYTQSRQVFFEKFTQLSPL